MSFSKDVRVTREFVFTSSYFTATIWDRTITVKSEYEYYITKWDIEDPIFTKKVSKEEYDSCGYTDSYMITNADVYTRECKQFVVFDMRTYYIRIQLGPHCDAEEIAEATAERLQDYMDNPETLDAEDFEVTDDIESGNGAIISFVQKF